MTKRIVKITKATYDRLDSELASTFKAVRIYDEELQANENKREILLVDSTYVDKISTEFKTLIKQ